MVGLHMKDMLQVVGCSLQKLARARRSSFPVVRVSTIQIKSGSYSTAAVALEQGRGPKLVCHFIPVCSDLSTESPRIPQDRGKAACRSALIYLLTLLGLFPNSDCLDYFKRIFKNCSLDPFLLWASVSSAIEEIGGLENYVL